MHLGACTGSLHMCSNSGTCTYTYTGKLLHTGVSKQTYIFGSTWQPGATSPASPWPPSFTLSTVASGRIPMPMGLEMSIMNDFSETSSMGPCRSKEKNNNRKKKNRIARCVTHRHTSAFALPKYTVLSAPRIY